METDLIKRTPDDKDQTSLILEGKFFQSGIEKSKSNLG